MANPWTGNYKQVEESSPSTPEVLNLFIISNQVSMNLIMLINVKMLAILTFISMMSLTLKASEVFILQ